MSWWISLVNEDDSPVSVERHAEGGTYAIEGVLGAELNVTYNYGGEFKKAGIRMFREGNLHGRQAKDTIAILEQAVAELGTERSADYWEATAGNAGYALSILLGWARQHPEARWRVR